MPPQALFNVQDFDFDKVLYDLDEIRKVNPQRFEMEQLTAIVFLDEEQDGIVGYKDLTEDEFWVRGHMPGYALMPGVLLCEAAAQLAGFYARKADCLRSKYVGFGGLDDVRFRAPVFPGSRLVLMAKATRIRPGRRAEFVFQGFVDEKMVFSGNMIGVPIDPPQ